MGHVGFWARRKKPQPAARIEQKDVIERFPASQDVDQAWPFITELARQGRITEVGVNQERAAAPMRNQLRIIGGNC